MDPITIYAAAALTALQPYLPTIATKAAEKIGSELPTAVGKLWTSIRTKLDTKTTAKEALKDLLADPTDSDLQAAFRVQLKKMLQEDSTFAGEIKRLLNETGTQGDTTYKAKVEGSGAIAQGPGARSVGEGGIMIEGGVQGDFSVDREKPDKE